MNINYTNDVDLVVGNISRQQSVPFTSIFLGYMSRRLSQTVEREIISSQNLRLYTNGHQKVID